MRLTPPDFWYGGDNAAARAKAAALSVFSAVYFICHTLHHTHSRPVTTPVAGI